MNLVVFIFLILLLKETPAVGSDVDSDDEEIFLIGESLSLPSSPSREGSTLHELLEASRKQSAAMSDLWLQSLKLDLLLSRPAPTAPVIPTTVVPTPVVLASVVPDVNLFNLASRRLNNEMLVNSVSFRFSGDGELYNYQKSLAIKGGERVFNLFAPHKLKEEVERLTVYEKVEIIFDTVFGLKTAEEGLPPPAKRDGSLNTLLQYKFDFVLGPNRDGLGNKYGYGVSTNHFSDHPDCKGSFPELRTGNAIIPNGKVTDFFSSYGVETDYERLKVLLDVLMVIKK